MQYLQSTESQVRNILDQNTFSHLEDKQTKDNH